MPQSAALISHKYMRCQSRVDMCQQGVRGVHGADLGDWHIVVQVPECHGHGVKGQHHATLCRSLALLPACPHLTSLCSSLHVVPSLHVCFTV